MHDDTRKGQLLRISEPKNHFPLAAKAKRSVLIAGGIGVTPILCMAERLAHIGADFEMHSCTRSEERTAFRDRIRRSAYAPRVAFHYDDGAPEQKFDIDQALGKPEDDVHLYVCGPGGFMDWVLTTARNRGWPDAQVHREYFAAAAGKQTGNGMFEVQLASSGRVFIIPENKSVVEVLRTEAVDILTSCEQGVCGTCLTRVLEGEPQHRDMFLTEEERARNDQFLPCCSRANSKRLVLDL